MWLIEKIISFIKGLFGKTTSFLCDTCMLDWRGACDNPERPNAQKCHNYKKR
ncbi:hypothetical protein KKG61_04155 [bacterium]|nr:hypothetical protein [bacterium]MBU1599281.1 hypothetical protein [bacterium]